MRFTFGVALMGLACFFFGFSFEEARADLLQQTEFQLGSGYRRGELSWNIAGNSDGGNPDVLSELEWKDLDVFQTRAEGLLLLGRTGAPNLWFYLKGSVAYGWILEGNNRDSDYAGDGRTLEFSRSENSGDGGDLLDLSIAAGPQFRFFDNKLAIALLAGWSYHEQNLEISKGRQTLSDPGIPGLQPVGRFPGLDSRYASKWWGPWLGTDIQWLLGNDFILSGAFSWHFADYEAKADWNLRSDLEHPVSFRHYADGRGVILALGLQYQLTVNWLLALHYDYQDWQTDRGNHRVYGADGSRGHSRLNEVTWQSQTVMLNLGCRF